LSYRYETHFHTDEVSPCGQVPAAESVKAYHEQGYAGIVVTDHYYGGLLRGLGDESLPDGERVDRWLRGWRLAKEAGDKLGLKVLLGMELRFEGHPEDYLVYGFTVERLKAGYRWYDMTAESFSAMARENGWYFGQAHPFRPGLTRCDPALLDGVEGFNGNKRHNSHDAMAQAFAKENGLLITSGADFHEWEDLARGGMTCETPIADEADWVRRLKAGQLTPDLSLTRAE
jgi:hypothetical protein